MTIDLRDATPLVLIGAGKMGGAMLTGWLDRGLPADGVVVIEPHASDDLKALAAARGVRLESAAPAGLTARIMVVAVKPQVLDAVLPPLAGLVGAETVVVSVVAGKTVAAFERGLGATRIVRTIPNTPSQVGRGITAAHAVAAVPAPDRDLVSVLLATLGRLEWVDREDLIDVATAVSGSGPAYVFHMVEALAAAGAAAGLEPALAARLARATVEGAGELLWRSPDEPETLRKNVTSPGGTTAAALAVLMGDDGLTKLMTEAVAAAAKRSRELAG
jgi:pyrroline-5-carboxylate reductase